MKIKIFLEKLKSSPNFLKILNYCLLALITFYFFSKIVFDRPSYTIIQNVALIVVFTLSIFKCVLYCEYRDFQLLIPLVAILFLSVVSNLFSLTFSYDFFILFLIACSSYYLAKSFNNKFKWEIIIGTYVVGFTLGMLVILFYYRNTLFSSTALGFDQHFLNMDGLGFSLASLSCLSFVLGMFLLKKKEKTLSVVCFVDSFFALVSSFKTYRIGCIIFLILFYLIFGLKFVFRKSKIAFTSILFTIFVIGLLILVIPSEITIINRIKLSLLQPFNFDLILDESVRERTFLLSSNFILSIMCPLIGIGYNRYFDISNTGSHSAFGSMSLNYGLLSLLLIMVVVFGIYKKYRNSGSKEKDIFIYYFLLHTLFSFVYGTAFGSRTYYFIFGSALFYAFNEISVDKENYPNYYEVRI